MKIKIAGDLKKLEFWAIEDEIPAIAGSGVSQPELFVHSFKNPVLIVDNAAIAKLPSTKRDAIIRLMEFPRRITEYDGVEIEWSGLKYPKVWSPSIDTILFAKTIKTLSEDAQYFNSLDSLLEIGSGSGYLSKYILKKKLESVKHLRSACLMDINRDALACAMDAIKPLKSNTLVSYCLNSPGQSIKTDQSYDLIIANPPYVPRPNSKTDNPFEGLFLYGEILAQAKKIMNPEGSLIINFSSISKDEVYPEFKKIFYMKTVEKMRVPLKIPLITSGLSDSSRNWMKYLLDNDKLEIDENEKSGYKFWQTIEIVKCNLK